MDPSPSQPQDAPEDVQRLSDNAFLDLIRSRIGGTPSQRNRNISWESNAADQIEWQLKDEDHRTWGFVEFLNRLRFRMEDAFDYFNGRDILDKFSLTVFDNQSLFNGASTNFIRQHFQQWCVDVYRTEQPRDDDTPVAVGRSPRYRYAIQVDTESLQSVVHDAIAPPEIDATNKGWVKLIDKSWYLGRSEGGMEDPLEPMKV